MPPVKSFGERIADALVEDGLLTSKQVEELLERQKKEGTRLQKLLLEKAYVTELDMVVCMGRVLNTPPVNLARTPLTPDLTEILPKDIANNHKVIPICRLDNKLFLAMADPLNVIAVDDVKRITKLEVVPMIATERAIMDKIANWDSAGSGSMEEIIQTAQKQADAESDAENLEVSNQSVDEVADIGALAASTEEAPV
ncbi:MAG: secretion system protein E, partial [Limisphaerales bacterium]